MKNIVLIFVLLALQGCQTGNVKSVNSSNNGLEMYGLIFGITKDDTGQVSSVRLARVEDSIAKKEIQFDLREDLLLQAKNKINKIWSSKANGREAGEEFFVICIYTNIDPNVVQCGEE